MFINVHSLIKKEKIEKKKEKLNKGLRLIKRVDVMMICNERLDIEKSLAESSDSSITIRNLFKLEKLGEHLLVHC